MHARKSPFKRSSRIEYSFHCPVLSLEGFTEFQHQFFDQSHASFEETPSCHTNLRGNDFTTVQNSVRTRMRSQHTYGKL